MFIDDINWAMLAPVFIIQLILMIVAIVDLVKVKETNGPKWLWALVIIFINLVGPIIYFIFGRRNR